MKFPNAESTLSKMKQFFSSRLILKTEILKISTIMFFLSLIYGLLQPVYPLYVVSLGASVSEYGLLVALGSAFTCVGLVVGGYFADKIGRRIVIISSLMLLPFFYAVYAFSTLLLLLFPLVMVVYFANGLRDPAVAAYLADCTSPGERGKCYGMYESIRTTGAVIGPIVGGALAYAFSLSIPFLVASVIALVALILALLRLSDVSALKSSSLQPQPYASMRFILTNTSLIPYLIMMSVDAFFSPVFFSYLALYLLRVSKVDVYQTGFVFTLLMLSIVVGEFLGGHLADKFGKRFILLLQNGISALVVFVISITVNLYLSLFAILVLGMIIGIGVPAYPALLASFASPAVRGKVMSLSNFISFIFAIPSLMIAGYLWENFWPGLVLQMAALAAFVEMMILLHYVKEPKEAQ